MIKHIVMMKFKEQAEGADAKGNALKMKDLLEALPAKINLIKEYEVGINFAESPAAMDLVLISGFDTTESLNDYRGHPEHVKVLDFLKKVVAETKVTDYEV